MDRLFQFGSDVGSDLCSHFFLFLFLCVCFSGVIVILASDM